MDRAGILRCALGWLGLAGLGGGEAFAADSTAQSSLSLTFAEAQSRFEIAAPLNHATPGDGPVLLAIPWREGNVRVEIEVAPEGPAATYTVKSESRRLSIDRRTIPAGAAATLVFNVNLRTPALRDGGSVALNERELGVWHWDDTLQLEIHGDRRRLRQLRLSKTPPETVTVFLAGDSTVTDQPAEPWIGWGQILPAFFGPEVVVANHAESGLALSTFRAHRRLDKLFEHFRPGDYLLIQFGHNDQKETGPGIGPWTSYRDHLRQLVTEARACGGHPILITPMQRRRFDADGRQFATLGDFPLVVRRVAAELAVPLLDLNAQSATLYAALGPEDSKRAFVHYPADTFPGQTTALRDDTHFNAYGGYSLALCITESLRLAGPGLARHLHPDLPPFDPAQPLPLDAVNFPPSPRATAAREQDAPATLFVPALLAK